MIESVFANLKQTHIKPSGGADQLGGVLNHGCGDEQCGVRGRGFSPVVIVGVVRVAGDVSWFPVTARAGRPLSPAQQAPRRR